MPIRPEQRALYPKDWSAIRLRILNRAQYACEWCGRRDHERQFVGPDGSWVDVNVAFVELNGDGIEVPDDWRLVKTVLTTAHLDHDPTNNDDANLASLCQKCHLTYDGPLHAGNASRTRDRKHGQVRMFEG